MAVNMIVIRFPWRLNGSEIEEWKRYFTSIGLTYRGYYPYADFTDMVLTANALSSETIQVLNSIEGIQYHIVPIGDDDIGTVSEESENQTSYGAPMPYGEYSAPEPYHKKPPSVPEMKVPEMQKPSIPKEIPESHTGTAEEQEIERLRKQITELEEYIDFVKRKSRSAEKQLKRLKKRLEEMEAYIEDEEAD